MELNLVYKRKFVLI